MNALHLIAECEDHGVTIGLDGSGSVILKGNPDAVRTIAGRLRPHREMLEAYLKVASRACAPETDDNQTRREVLSKLAVDRYSSDYCDEERRCNNIVFHLVTVMHWHFEEALQSAAHWVIRNPEHADETMFADVRDLLKNADR